MIHLHPLTRSTQKCEGSILGKMPMRAAVVVIIRPMAGNNPAGLGPLNRCGFLQFL
jgi:hypothetical protein